MSSEYETQVRHDLTYMQGVLDVLGDGDDLLGTVQNAGKALAAKISENAEVDKFSAAAALYELSKVDTNARFSVFNNKIADPFSTIEEITRSAADLVDAAPFILAQVQAAITLLDD